MRYLSTGQMAELCNVSKRTLQTYDEWGILKPAYIDVQNGYRFYTYDQCPRVDFIVYMKQLGFSLKDIRQFMDNPNPNALYEALCDCSQALAEQRRKISLSLYTLRRVIDNINFFRDKPQTDVIYLEHHQERKILCFEDKQKSYISQNNGSDSDMRNWEDLTRSFRRYLVSHGVSLSLFRNVGGIVRMESVLKKQSFCSGAFITVDDSFDLVPTQVMPEGDYLTCICASVVGARRNNSEVDVFYLLLDEIERKGYRVAGDYYGEEIVAGPALNYDGFDAMVRCQIPVIVPQRQQRRADDERR